MYLKYFFRVIKYLYFKYFKKVFYTTLARPLLDVCLRAGRVGRGVGGDSRVGGGYFWMDGRGYISDADVDISQLHVPGRDVSVRMADGKERCRPCSSLLL